MRRLWMHHSGGQTVIHDGTTAHTLFPRHNTHPGTHDFVLHDAGNTYTLHAWPHMTIVWTSESGDVCGIGHRMVAIARKSGPESPRRLWRMSTDDLIAHECCDMPFDVTSVRVSPDDAIVSCTTRTGDTFVINWNTEHAWTKALRAPPQATKLKSLHGDGMLRNGVHQIESIWHAVDPPHHVAKIGHEHAEHGCACIVQCGPHEYAGKDVLKAAAKHGSHSVCSVRHVLDCHNIACNAACCDNTVVVMTCPTGSCVAHGGHLLHGPTALHETGTVSVAFVRHTDLTPLPKNSTNLMAISSGDDVIVYRDTVEVFRAEATPPHVDLSADGVVAWVSASNPHQVLQRDLAVPSMPQRAVSVGGRVVSLHFGTDRLLLVTAVQPNNSMQDVFFLHAIDGPDVVRSTVLRHDFSDDVRLDDDGRSVICNGRVLARLPDRCVGVTPDGPGLGFAEVTSHGTVLAPTIIA